MCAADLAAEPSTSPATVNSTNSSTSKVPLILFGGTFDPVHHAHINAALAVSKALAGADVRLLPNALPPHRAQPVATSEQRLAMLAIATRDHPQLHVDDRELRRSGPSWTIDTLLELRSLHPDTPLVLVLGADSLASLHQWHRWQEYPALCHLAVLPRPGAAAPAPVVLNAFTEAGAASLLQQPAGLRLMLSAPLMEVSASAVRRALIKRGHSSALDEAVLAHIHQHGLYTVADNAIPDDEDS